MSKSKTTIISPLLHYPVFRCLWIGLTTSRIGDELTIIAVIWFLLELTGSGVAIGIVLLCFQIPSILTSPFLGKLLDRCQPRSIMVFDNVSRGCLIATIPILYYLDALEIWHIYVMALLVGILWPATEVGVDVVIPQVVSDEELEGANTLSSVVWEIATLAGPALGGILIILIGGPAVLLLDALSFLIMGSMLLSIPDLPRSQTQEKQEEGRSLLGFGTLIRMRLVFLLTMMTLFMLFAQGLQSVALSVYSQQTLATGAFGYGLLLSAFGVGSLLGLIVNHRFISQLSRPAMALGAIFVLFGLLTLPLFFLKNLLLAILFLVLGGFIAGPYFVIGRTLMQRLVPVHLRGEVFGVQGALGVAGYPLGGAVGGLFIDYFTAPAAIGLSALGCMVVGVVSLLSPALQGIKSREIRKSHHDLKHQEI